MGRSEVQLAWRSRFFGGMELTDFFFNLIEIYLMYKKLHVFSVYILMGLYICLHPVITITANKVISISIASKSIFVFPCFIIICGKNKLA